MLDNLTRKTVLRTARDFDGPDTTPLLISNLRHCYVYILACLAEIKITECVDSIIVAGVTRMVTLENCVGCTVISITRATKIQGCSHTIAHMCVNTRPVLTLNSSLVLAPYNSFYSQLDAHIQQMGIKTALQENLWNQPTEVKRKQSVSVMVNRKALDEKPVTTYTLMDPNDFSPFVVPFQLPGHTKANPVELPIEYTEALRRKTERINSLKSMIQAVPDASKDQFRTVIEEKFREWLVQSGNIDQVNDLINFHLQ